MKIFIFNNRRLFCSSIVTIFCLVFLSCNLAFSNELSTFTPKYEIVDLDANFYSDETILYVTGKVKNTSFSPLSGHVIVRLKDKNDNNVGFVETEVNKNLPIEHNKKGSFEISINIENILKPSNVSIEFLKKN